MVPSEELNALSGHEQHLQCFVCMICTEASRLPWATRSPVCSQWHCEVEVCRPVCSSSRSMLLLSTICSWAPVTLPNYRTRCAQSIWQMSASENMVRKKHDSAMSLSSFLYLEVGTQWQTRLNLRKGLAPKLWVKYLSITCWFTLQFWKSVLSEMSCILCFLNVVLLYKVLCRQETIVSCWRSTKWSEW